MDKNLKDIYLVKFSEDGNYTDITALVDGVRILKIDGFLNVGKPVNVYTAHWVDSQEEDFMITTLDDDENPVVVRENVDIEITFIVGNKYAENPLLVDVNKKHDEFIRLMTYNDLWIKSNYVDREVHCVCLEEYSPTLIKLHRGQRSYIMGTIKLHTLDKPSPTPTN